MPRSVREARAVLELWRRGWPMSVTRHHRDLCVVSHSRSRAISSSVRLEVCATGLVAPVGRKAHRP